jgi:hypothetical protein
MGIGDSLKDVATAWGVTAYPDRGGLSFSHWEGGNGIITGEDGYDTWTEDLSMEYFSKSNQNSVVARISGGFDTK